MPLERFIFRRAGTGDEAGPPLPGQAAQRAGLPGRFPPPPTRTSGRPGTGGKGWGPASLQLSLEFSRLGLTLTLRIVTDKALA